MTQNIQPDYMLEHPAPGRPYPTARTTGPIPSVGVDTGYTTFLGQAGYPDTEESALAFAAGQRMAARKNESRSALTTGAPDAYASDALMAPPGTGPAQPVIVTRGPIQAYGG